MQISRIVRGVPDKVFIIVKNAEASTTLADGHTVVHDVATTANHGVDVKLSGTGADELIVAGIISAGTNGIPAGSYGLCQVYGYHDNVLTLTTAIAAGVTVGSSTTAGALDVGATLGAVIGVTLRLGAAAAFRCGVMIKMM